MIVVGIFGGTKGADDAEQMALSLGADVSCDPGHLVLTGGDDPNGSGAKNKALSAAADRGRRWIGVTKTGPIRDQPCGAGVVLHTGSGSRRNFLEGCLVDAAIALPGGKGTISEAVSTLCLGKPVLFVGDRWRQHGSPLGPVLDKIAVGQTITDAEWDVWTTQAMHRLSGDTLPSLGLMIDRTVVAANLHGAEFRINHLPTSLLSEAMPTLATFNVAIAHAFPPLGDEYEPIRDRYAEYVGRE